MSACTNFIETIDAAECLKDSFFKLNDNFQQLDDKVCLLKQRADKKKQIRTFFYYGPNSSIDPTSGTDNNNLTRPSDLVITIFVNAPSQLNLPSISKVGDEAYVIYQKTGFSTTLGNDITINQIQPSSESTIDITNIFVPVFIVWRLIFNGVQYEIATNEGYPKYTQAITNMNPTTWATY